MKITREMIIEAAERLQSEGKNPTLTAVRAAVGGGSFSTIQPVLSEWRDGQKAPTAPIREFAPQAITDRVQALAAEIWSEALELANGRLKAEREALQAERAQYEAERDEAAELADELTTEIETLKSLNEVHMQTIENQTTQLAEHEARIVDLNQALAVSTSTNTHLEDRLEAEKARIETNQKMYQELSQRNRELEQEAARADAVIVALKQDMDRLNVEAVSRETKITDLTSKLFVGSSKLTELETELRLTKEQAATYQRRFDAVQDEIKEIYKAKANRKGLKPKSEDGSND
ncbi:DNA-binding protein [Paenibacillus sp. y28]|uniref:DNA-binding protein n=1 Tax=Paenibacillus sp. y28 TaxID=3129110 RepID=UPI00301AFE91